MTVGKPRYGKKMWARKLRDWNNTCAKCGKSFPPEDLTQGHLFPRSRGGERNAGNLVPLCRECNQEDGNILASYDQMDLTTTVRLAPDADTSALLAAQAEETGEPIHGHTSYVNFPFGKRVEITADIPGVTLPNRQGIIESFDAGADQYWIALDDPWVCENGIYRRTAHIVANRAGIRYLDADPTVD